MDLLPFLSPAESPRGTVLLAHGFGEHHGRYGEFVSALNSADYDVWTFDFTGHGVSPGARAAVNVGQLIAEHLQARRDLQQVARTEKIFLFGHSMGGLITLASTLLSPPHLTAVAVTGPALRPLPSIPLFAAKLGAAIARIIPGLTSVAIDNTLLSHDPEVALAYGSAPLVYEGKVPLLTGATMVIQGQEVLANAPLLARPVLILHGDEDVLANPEGSAEFVARARGKAELRMVEGAYHELLNEVDREAYAQEIIAWYDTW